MLLPLHDLNPTARPALVTGGIIAACFAVFLWQLQVGLDVSVIVGGMVPDVLAGMNGYDLMRILPDVWGKVDPSENWGWFTVLSHMFMHGGWMHIIFNMYFLWLFGDNVEDALGRGRYLLFYLLCGLSAAIMYAIIDGGAVPMVGASGAISGVMGAYVARFPHAQVRTLLLMGIFTRIILLPAWLLIAFWFGRDVLSWLLIQQAGGGGGGVAHMAHIGGFAAGWILMKSNVLQSRHAGPWG
ncbi:MAG: rhomboid family intramembrane serine protease [Proteobacteria bacterium]|nr:rhomboid family intramembrane serine protease [Pseudomonadota bacterium]